VLWAYSQLLAHYIQRRFLLRLLLASWQPALSFLEIEAVLQAAAPPAGGADRYLAGQSGDDPVPGPYVSPELRWLLQDVETLCVGPPSGLLSMWPIFGRQVLQVKGNGQHSSVHNGNVDGPDHRSKTSSRAL
jgi:hypothetical protein